MPSISRHVPAGVRIVAQGEYVANSLQLYLARHPEIDAMCTKHATCRYLTTESEEKFKDNARIFLHEQVDVQHIDLE